MKIKILGLLVLLTSKFVVGVETTEGNIKATMDGKSFEAKVVCINFDTEQFDKKFTFITDNGKSKDTDGDGIWIRGDKMKMDMPGMKLNGVEISFTADGVSYKSDISTSAAMRKKEKWEKTDTNIKGEVKVFRKGDTSLKGKAHLFVYDVKCK